MKGHTHKKKYARKYARKYTENILKMQQISHNKTYNMREKLEKKSLKACTKVKKIDLKTLSKINIMCNKIQ